MEFNLIKKKAEEAKLIFKSYKIYGSIYISAGAIDLLNINLDDHVSFNIDDDGDILFFKADDNIRFKRAVHRDTKRLYFCSAKLAKMLNVGKNENCEFILEAKDDKFKLIKNG